MYNSISPEHELIRFVQDTIKLEQPLSTLEVSGYDQSLGQMIRDYSKTVLSEAFSANAPRFDRIDLTDFSIAFENNTYSNVYSTDYLVNIEEMCRYDVILVFHLVENMVDVDAKSLIESLLMRVNKQILVITPIYPYDLSSDNKLSCVRSYHPVFFLGMDFSYMLLETSGGTLQAYSFFPKRNYPLLPCDIFPEISDVPSSVRKLRVAFIVPHHQLTGCLKAMLQQMKEMKKNGHIVTAVYRSNDADSAIPPWSHLTDDDVSGQIIIPSDDKYLEHINNVDIIMLSWMSQVPEFCHSVIPVVLWEQGSEMLYGEYTRVMGMQNSQSLERMHMHNVFRTPVHLFAVSPQVQAVLKGVYNRESQFFPYNLDTDFYYPLKEKNNDIPIILLVGKPTLSFKGFDVAVNVLQRVRNAGYSFKVAWATPSEFTSSGVSLEFELFIKPSQEKLAELYRNADIYLSTSLYESLPLPPLEAMASGTAVIATDNGGINTYAKPGVNCLLCEQGDLDSVAVAIQYLLTNPEARILLAEEGRKTAIEYSYDKIVPKLEQCFHKILGIC